MTNWSYKKKKQFPHLRLLQLSAALKPIFSVMVSATLPTISAAPPKYHTVGLATKFRSEKIPRNCLGTVSVIPRKNMLIPRHSGVHGRVNSEARSGTEGNYAVKN
jgi:hypothetical protein